MVREIYRRTYYLYLILFSVTFLLWVLSKPNIQSLGNFPLLSFSQIAALFGAVLISFNFILSSRVRFVNKFFGGLDKAYKQHGMMGRIAFGLILFHPALLILDSLGNWEIVKQYILPSGFMPYEYGKFALLIFSVIVILTIFVRLPYHIWLYIHRFMGLPLLLITLHVASISSDVSRFFPLRVWILGILLSGLFAYLYKVFLYKHIGPKYFYEVVKTIKKSFVTEVYFKARGKEIDYNPGQFAFFVFESAKVSDEEHPFTLSSSSTDDLVRISVKKVGDFTKTLPNLKKGDLVTLYGPYGSFGECVVKNDEKFIMIAGGIGITPFLSIVRYLVKLGIERRIDLFYVVRNKSDAVYKNEISSLIRNFRTIKFYVHISSKEGRFKLKDVIKITENLQDRKVLLCGPVSMMKSLSMQLIKKGVPESDIFYEEFNLK